MTNDSLVFYVSFPVKGDEWQVQCSVTALCDDPYDFVTEEQVDVVRIMNAENGDTKLDEQAWKDLLKTNDLLGAFCEQMMSYLSFLMWTLSRPIAQA